MRTVTVFTILLALVCGGSSCLSQELRREEAILQHSAASGEKYADLLVDMQRYTTAGREYHQKYRRHLLGIAAAVVESRKLAVEKGSVGFYFDKKSNETDKLFLGLDIATNAESAEPYGATALRLMRGTIGDIIATVHSCRSIFDEKQIEGMVIGWKWKSGGSPESVTVWIPKRYLLRFEEGKKTLGELLQMSTVTNTQGRVIRLP